jgi:hypothetical protein
MYGNNNQQNTCSSIYPPYEYYWVKAWFGVSKVAFESPQSNTINFFVVLTIIKP